MSNNQNIRPGYAYRTIVYTKNNDSISLIDKHEGGAEIPLDPWLGTVVMLADGQHTIQELIDNLGNKYPNGVPANFENTINSVIKRLLDSGVIKISAEPVDLVYYLSIPWEEQDQQKSKKLMEIDNYLL